MTRIPALSHFSETADAQIGSAVLRMAELIARQAARELAADAPDLMETSDATEPTQED